MGTSRLRAALVAWSLVLSACATTGGRTVAIPAAAQPDWDRCRPVFVTYCHGVANGDPPHERECLENSTREYVHASTEAARRQYLVAHGCAL